ncbi:MAG: coiled coil domain-containing protein [Desulfotignum sp.]|nr:coiled coil domain-containing protein [Desulfotignum sp.]
MSKKEAYEKKLEAQLKEWKTDIDKMKAKADKADAEAKLEYYKQIEDLQSKQEAVQKKLTELKAADESAWEDLKSGIDLAWTSLGESIKSPRSRFN